MSDLRVPIPRTAKLAKRLWNIMDEIKKVIGEFGSGGGGVTGPVVVAGELMDIMLKSSIALSLFSEITGRRVAVALTVTDRKYGFACTFYPLVYVIASLRASGFLAAVILKAIESGKIKPRHTVGGKCAAVDFIRMAVKHEADVVDKLENEAVKMLAAEMGGDPETAVMAAVDMNRERDVVLFNRCVGCWYALRMAPPMALLDLTRYVKWIIEPGKCVLCSLSTRLCGCAEYPDPPIEEWVKNGVADLSYLPLCETHRKMAAEAVRLRLGRE